MQKGSTSLRSLRTLLVVEELNEFQWTILVLVGDRKGVRPHSLCTNYPSCNVLPSILYLHHRPFCSLRRTRCRDYIKQDVWRVRVKENRLTIRLEEWRLNQHMCVTLQRTMLMSCNIQAFESTV